MTDEREKLIADELLKLRAENERLREELDIWKSVFPDIAPEQVLPDRSAEQAELARLRAENETLKQSNIYEKAEVKP